MYGFSHCGTLFPSEKEYHEKFQLSRLKVSLGVDELI